MSKPTRTTRLRCESLEARDVPAAPFYPQTAEGLVTAVATANGTPEADAIVLTAGTKYTLTAVNNATFGPTGLPVIEAEGGPLTIVGNGATIERSPTAGTPQNPAYFRLLAVEPGARLDVSGLILQGGFAQGTPTLPARGGAVYSLGTVDLTDVIVQNNTAYGDQGDLSPGGGAQGGGVWSGGGLTIVGGTIQGNRATGGLGADGQWDRGGTGGSGRAGGSGAGGGVYVAAGTATLTHVTLEANVARGGDGGDGTKQTGGRSVANGGSGGNGRGGGIHTTGGTTTLTRCIVKQNEAIAGAGGNAGWRGKAGTDGAGEGGGIYVGPGVAADWDADTVFRGNTTSTRGKNFFRA